MCSALPPTRHHAFCRPHISFVSLLPTSGRVFYSRGEDCFKGGVRNARRADKHNRHFVGVGHAPPATAENVRRHGMTEASIGLKYGTHSRKMTLHRSQIWET